MPDIQDFWKDSNKNRRDESEARITDGLFKKKDLAKPIPTFRPRVTGESLREYREIEYLYYQGLLDERWGLYLDRVEKEIVKKYDYGGAATVVNLANQGYFEIPGELIRYDMYDIQGNSSMIQLLEMTIPVDMQAQQIAAYLESKAWRTAAETADRLSGVLADDVKRLANESMARVLGDPEFGRKQFVELLKGPLDGTLPITGEARARMIARTETTRAKAEASEELANAMRSQGYQLVEVWHTSQNTNVCPECQALEGTVRGSGWTDYPPLHPNCDCEIFVEMLDA